MRERGWWEEDGKGPDFERVQDSMQFYLYSTKLQKMSSQVYKDEFSTCRCNKAAD